MRPNGELLRSLGTLVSLLDSPSSNDIGQTNPFEVKVPIDRSHVDACQITLVNGHFFANSYGKPFISEYEPSCPGKWDLIVLDMNGAVKGRQFDRTGALWISGSELWRYTTPEPNLNGIEYHVEKDVTAYAAVLEKRGPLVLALDNIVNEIYTGVFQISLTVTFYSKKTPVHPGSIAHTVVPISAGSLSYGWFHLSDPDNVNVTVQTLPIESKRAVLEIFLSSHECDEFWYSLTLSYSRYGNAPDNYYPEASICRGGPFKELQVYVDGILVGVDWPLATIYTGGLNPLLWRPISGMGSFDVPSYKLDVSPFLGILNDGRRHVITLRMLNARNLWKISANLLLWSDSQSVSGRPEPWHFHAYEPFVDGQVDENNDASFLTKVDRSYRSVGHFKTSLGIIQTTVVKILKLDSLVTFKNNTDVQSFSYRQKIEERIEVFLNRKQMATISRETKQYLIGFVDFLPYDDGSFSLRVRVDNTLSKTHRQSTTDPHKLSVQLFRQGRPVRPNFEIIKTDNHQVGHGSFMSKGGGNAKMHQLYKFRHGDYCYQREVRSANRTLVKDDINTLCDE